MGKPISLQYFVKSASIVHSNKYDYSAVAIINTKSKVRIICPIHGVFEQIPSHHINGSGCAKCYGNNRKTIEKFISEANIVHSNKYDYSLVEYKSTHTKVEIICHIHGKFEQKPAHHLNGSGCPKCGNDVVSKELFIEKAKKIHGNYYDYSLVDFISTKKKVKIKCPLHDVFEQQPSHHYNGAGCPICRESKGEREIRNFLIEKKIIFIRQHRFQDCRDKRSLPFDFYLPELNTCIEYDGEQHFKSKERWGGETGLLDRQKKDKIKTEYCKNNNIKLIRIKNGNKLIDL